MLIYIFIVGQSTEPEGSPELDFNPKTGQPSAQARRPHPGPVEESQLLELRASHSKAASQAASTVQLFSILPKSRLGGHRHHDSRLL